MNVKAGILGRRLLMVGHEELIKLLDYDKNTGLFIWKISRGPLKKGSVAGAFNHPKKYVYIQINKIMYSAHRLAWFYVYKVWPCDQLDHKDLDRQNNRIDNLRECNNSQNRMNTNTHKNNLLGVKGVGYKKRIDKYQAKIRINNKDIYLGVYKNIEDASNAYRAAEIKYFGEFARTAL